MRFAATHKAVSYLMVTTAFVMLMLTGELRYIQIKLHILKYDETNVYENYL